MQVSLADRLPCPDAMKVSLDIDALPAHAMRDVPPAHPANEQNHFSFFNKFSTSKGFVRHYIYVIIII